MEDAEFAEVARIAEALMEEEEQFESTSVEATSVPDPRVRAAVDPSSIYAKGAPVKISSRDLAILKMRFPRLKEFSDDFLQARSMDELLKIESTSLKLKEAERRGDIEERLAFNKQNLEANHIMVPESADNRWTILHPGRFLAGAACSAKKLWLSAREMTDVNGHSPVANYDMTAVGLGGYVTGRGWIELANPASTRMSLKLFNINNMGSKAGKLNSQGAEEFDEISELGEFKLALRTLRTAAQLVCPWNLSYLALEGFLIQQDFCMSDLSGTANPAVTLTQFVDYILHENANRWRDAEAFISACELKGYWSSFSGARPKVLLKKKEPLVNSNYGAKSSFSGQLKQGSFHFLPKNSARINLPFTDACRLWNSGKCKKAGGTCTTSKGIPLRHVCNFSDLSNPNATVCGQQHQSSMFH